LDAIRKGSVQAVHLNTPQQPVPVFLAIMKFPPCLCFDMELWNAYIDESYNDKTFCVGGFLAPVGIWNGITYDWASRIEFENRISDRKGFRPISRYHATDCGNLKREFSKENGWTIERQINLTTRLCEILGKHGPTGIVIGGAIDDVRRYISPDRDEPDEFLYSTCFKTCLLDIAVLMREHVVDGRVRVFYERSDFSPLAKEAFDMFKGDGNPTFDCVLSVEEVGWEKCVPLQAADFMAYQGFKLIESSLKGKEQIKKSLQALIDKDIPLIIAHFQDQNFADIMRMIANKKEGRPLEDGVESGFKECVGRLPYIPA
jgi:hypothetical protein